MSNMAENAASHISGNTHPTMYHCEDVSWNSSLWMVPQADSSQHLNCVASPHQSRHVSPCPSTSSLYEPQSGQASSLSSPIYEYQSSEANLNIEGGDHIEGDALNDTLDIGKTSFCMSQIPLAQLLHHYQDHIEGNTLNDNLDVGEPSEAWKQDWQSKMDLCWLKFSNYEWPSIVRILNSRGKTREKTAYMTKFNRVRNLIDDIGCAALSDKHYQAARMYEMLWKTDLSVEEIIDFEYNDTWNRLAARIKKDDKHASWSAERIKWAWEHGVSSFYPDVLLQPVGWTSRPSRGGLLSRDELCRLLGLESPTT